MEEEADETTFWLEMIEEAGLLPPERIVLIKRDTHEVLSILVSPIKTLKAKDITKP